MLDCNPLHGIGSNGKDGAAGLGYFFSMQRVMRLFFPAFAIAAIGLPIYSQASEADPFRLNGWDYAFGAAEVAVEIPAYIRYNDMPSADTGSLNRNDLLPFDRWVA